MRAPKTAVSVQQTGTTRFSERAISNGLDLSIGMPLPTVVSYAFENIPDELKQLPRWMPFRFAANSSWAPGAARPWSKLPINPATGRPASVADPATSGTYEQALAYFLTHAEDEDPRTVAHGLGISIGPPYVLCDLDHRVSNGLPDDFALAILKRLKTYSELSVSGQGLHLIARGSLDEQGRRHSGLGLEMYCGRRFATITGHVLEGHCVICDRQIELEALVAEIWAPARGDSENGVQKSSPCIHTVGGCELQQPPTGPAATRNRTGRSEAAVLRLIQQDRKTTRLWRGDWSQYPSHNEADAALVEKLLLYGGEDPDIADRLFRRSGLMRARSGTGGAAVRRLVSVRLSAFSHGWKRAGSR